MSYPKKLPPLSSFSNQTSFSLKSSSNKITPFLSSQQSKANTHRKEVERTYSTFNKKKINESRKSDSRSQISGGQSSLQRYAVSKNVSSMKGRKYDLDAKNVFYEDSQMVREIEVIKAARPILASIFMVLLACFFVLFWVTPFAGYCPNNAECGAYINCNPGYELNGVYCQISKQVIESAQQICKTSIENLKYQYGNTECLEEGDYNSLVIPVKKIQELFQQFDIEENRPLTVQIINWLQKRQNQIKHKFTFSQSQIIPNEKAYSLVCSLHFYSRKESFKYAMAAFMLFLCAILWLIRERYYHSHANKIYTYLQRQLASKIDIVLDKEHLEKRFGNISFKVWDFVEKQRASRGKIVYYVDNQGVHWVSSR